ncbi:outer membrane protein assembly factor BamB family protein [Dictyobacter kobayashii]|uniref:outer membrane protein assembly factor BamB family protein n=1 Tax=Dictyobacter kobayashii TaxID=2014872 RepID=UPI0013871A97
MVWTHVLGNSSTTTPVAVGSVIYITAMASGTSTDQIVYAIDSTNGHTLWQVTMPSDTQVQRISITPAMRDMYKQMNQPLPANQKYIDNTISYTALATPTFANGVLYLENEGGRITALNANTGKILWVHEVEDKAMVDGTRYTAHQLVVVNNVVYGSIHKTLFALNAQNGKGIWTSSIDASQIFSAPIVSNNIIYTGSSHAGSHTTTNYAAYAYAYNAHTGQQIWTQNLSAQYNIGDPTLANNMLYLGAQNLSAGTGPGGIDTNYTFFALDTQSGTIKWQNHIGSPFATPLVENNVLYLQQSSTSVQGVEQTPDILHAYDAATGNELWNKNIDGISPFELHNGVIYGVGPDHKLSALSTKDGSVLWQAIGASTALDKMKIDGGRVYTGTIEP